MAEEMIIMTKTYDLISWLIPKSEKFPKAYRTTLTQRLMDSALDFQEEIFAAVNQSGSNKTKHLLTADAHLTSLRLYLRLAFNNRMINDGQYRHASVMVTEIGRLLGGWQSAHKTRKG